MTDAMSRFIAAESARLRAVGIPEARIAWLLGTKPPDANVDAPRPKRGRPFGVKNGDLRAAVEKALSDGKRLTYSELAAAVGRNRSSIKTWCRINDWYGVVQRFWCTDGTTRVGLPVGRSK